MPAARWELFAGKGGVGKTTLAAARAVGLAARGERVLAVSTDPAHSLGDALDTPLGPRPRPVPGCAGLAAVEVDAPAAARAWIERLGEVLTLAIERGTLLDANDAAEVLGLPLPGVDELMGLQEAARLAGDAGVVVVDTAPTGHLLRLLSAPRLLLRLADLLDTLQERHHELARAFGAGASADAVDTAVRRLREEAEALQARLADPRALRARWVTTPERLAVAETLRALGELDRRALPVDQVLVNRWPVAAPRRERLARAALGRLRRGVGDTPVAVVAEAMGEPRGIEGLRALADAQGEVGAPAPPPSVARSPGRGRVRGGQAAGGGAAPDWPRRICPIGVDLLLFGGKGGVGKTTCAAAAAIVLAEIDATRPVLLLSTDPAPSLAALFGRRGGDSEQPLPGGPANLRWRELDAAAEQARRHQRLREALDELFSRLGRGIDLPLDRELLDRLATTAPPGLDELAAIAALLEHPAGEGRRLLVLDTAPSGHALRLLESPQLALAWDHALMRLLLKYRGTGAPAALGRDLLELAGELRKLQARLREPARTRFVAVTRSGELPARETRRLLAALGRLEIPVAATLLNLAPHEPAALAAATDRLRRPNQDAASPAILLASARLPPPRGSGALARWARDWRWADAAGPPEAQAP